MATLREMYVGFIMKAMKIYDVIRLVAENHFEAEELDEAVSTAFAEVIQLYNKNDAPTISSVVCSAWNIEEVNYPKLEEMKSEIYAAHFLLMRLIWESDCNLDYLDRFLPKMVSIKGWC